MIMPQDTSAPQPSKTTAPKAAPVTVDVPAPTVETTATFEPGAKVRHLNGAEYLVRHQTAEGVALQGVANLVHPSALTLI